jgi:hypothetical protein
MRIWWIARIEHVMIQSVKLHLPGGDDQLIVRERPKAGWLDGAALPARDNCA